jgi:argininosuccinate lyase
MLKPNDPPPTEKKGLWGGRFREGMAPEMVPLNRSLGTDYRLWPQDVRGSQAWAGALTRAGVLTQDEGETLISGLTAVGDRLARESLQVAPEEDIHSLVERLLSEEVGDVAGKLHTGRSRNDQVATDFRLWGMGATRALEDELKRLLRVLLALAENSLDPILPGYTHLQQAQPIRAAHWVMSHFWPLLRDRDRIRRVWESASVLPLGSGALAGCPFPVDREWLRESLGFQRISQNSLDAVSDRDWALELAFTGALLGTHFSRLAEDLVLFSSKEFGYLILSDGFSTGSSLMPQKRNPDVAELIRGKTGRLLGNLTGLLVLLKGLPTGYNRDLQEDKDLLFDTVDTLLLVTPPLAGAMGTARFDSEAMGRNRSPELFATDLADHLVRAGVPFRKAHEAVGEAVRAAEDRGESLLELPSEVLQGIHPEFPDHPSGLFSWESSVEARAIPGGTARAAVEAQIQQGRETLEAQE